LILSPLQYHSIDTLVDGILTEKATDTSVSMDILPTSAGGGEITYVDVVMAGMALILIEKVAHEPPGSNLICPKYTAALVKPLENLNLSSTDGTLKACEVA
jgi:hypothetical protein